MQFYANYKFDIKRHSISLMAGYEDYSYKWENESASRTNYTLDNFPYLDLGPEDYQYNSGSAGHNAYRSVFGRIMNRNGACPSPFRGSKNIPSSSLQKRFGKRIDQSQRPLSLQQLCHEYPDRRQRGTGRYCGGEPFRTASHPRQSYHRRDAHGLSRPFAGHPRTECR